MKGKRFTRFVLMKFGLLLFSLILLLIILIQIILSYEEIFAPNKLINLIIVILSILIAAVLSISVFEALTVKEYRGYFIKKTHIKKGRSYLSLEDIFENENRINILTQILNNPGIHQNEILRSCNLKKGQLQWHLDVLLKYHIIKKENYGQYTIYFPITSSIESIETFKNLPTTKSETTSKILEIVQKNPGISSSEVSKKIDLARNTVKYHIDKLLASNLILLKGKGRKLEIYPKFDDN